MEIQRDYLAEYEKLSPEEREEIVETFKLTKDDYSKVKRPSAKGRIQCITNGVQNMQKIVSLFIVVIAAASDRYLTDH